MQNPKYQVKCTRKLLHCRESIADTCCEFAKSLHAKCDLFVQSFIRKALETHESMLSNEAIQGIVLNSLVIRQRYHRY